MYRSLANFQKTEKNEMKAALYEGKVLRKNVQF